ncbi:hypothetical protein [Oenococcus sicerae]|uniref:hypothetical protein n=1 Tax=Oenococcus sicerae TaxID=2203724 RepID=UPI0010B5D447|nr:hypothetical protein OAL24_00883 [Oenococcus sicerae]
MMFYLAITFWILSLISWIALQFFARDYKISDWPFWNWLLPADFFLVIELINHTFTFNFQFIAIFVWLLLWLLIALMLLFKSDDQRSLKKFWFSFINISSTVLLLELAVIFVLSLLKH